MAAIIYLDIVKTPELNGEVCVHSFVVNPSAKSDRQKDTYFMATPIGYTRLKLAELCRIIENIGLPTGSQIVVFSSDIISIGPDSRHDHLRGQFAVIGH